MIPPLSSYATASGPPSSDLSQRMKDLQLYSSPGQSLPQQHGFTDHGRPQATYHTQLAFNSLSAFNNNSSGEDKLSQTSTHNQEQIINGNLANLRFSSPQTLNKPLSPTGFSQCYQNAPFCSLPSPQSVNKPNPTGLSQSHQSAPPSSLPPPQSINKPPPPTGFNHSYQSEPPSYLPPPQSINRPAPLTGFNQGYQSALPSNLPPPQSVNRPLPPTVFNQSYQSAQASNLPPQYNSIASNSPHSHSIYSEPPGSVPGPYPYSSQSLPQVQTIQLDQLPSPIKFREEDQQNRGGHYSTDVKGVPPPLATTNFIVQDRGMCSPRYIRSTMYCLPNHADLLKQTAIPFGLNLCPMAALNQEEASLPTALFREEGPVRCRRCKAYVCSFMTFTEGGRSFQCAFCKVVTEVPQDYFCFLDNVGERTDKYHRPELCLGSFEYFATKDYCRNEEMPNPPAYVFMIEVSHATFRNGFIPLLCENMKSVLQCLKNSQQADTSKLRIGFVTYNRVLHFYNMKKNLSQPHIMVLSDVHNAFMPLVDGFLVTLSEAEDLVDSLMEHIPCLFVNEPAAEIILGPVIQVGLEALKNANCSGKLLIFHSSLPNADAPGKLTHREGQKLLGTDKQKTILSPQNDFYTKLAQECVAASCAVDLFLFPNAYIDIASLSQLSQFTGGQIFKYTYFQSHTDGDRFLEDLKRDIVTPTAFDAVLRVRTSAGISPISYYGNFFMANTTDIELSAIDCYKGVSIELAYDEKLSENETVYLQAALLYTSITGERRIRVHNLALATSLAVRDLFRCCDMDAVVNILAKQALKQVLEIPPLQIKNSIISRAVKILSCYRKHCSESSPDTQLLLPDSLKVLPLYLNCLIKSDAIGGGSDLSLDDRSFAMVAVNSMDVKSTATYFYPSLIPLHEVDPSSDGIPLPSRCSIEKLKDNGAYLLVNGIYMFLWLGQAISSNWLQDVFGVQSASQVDKQKISLPELNTLLSQKVRSIIDKLKEGCQWNMRLALMVQGDKLEIVFRQFLVEDRGTDGSPSYIDFLCLLHKNISKNL